MAYQVVSALANSRAVVEAFADFAVANGWTQVYRTTAGSVTSVGLHIPGTTDYIHLWNDAAGQILSRISVGYDSAQGPSTQPGPSPANCITNTQGAGPFPRTFMFAMGSELDLIILNAASATYAHIAIGCVTKYGTYDGGTYADGTYFPTSGSTVGNWGAGGHGVLGFNRLAQSGFLRADTDGRANFYHAFGETVTNEQGVITGIAPEDANAINMGIADGRGTGFLSRLLYAGDNNTFSGRSFLQPIEMQVRRAGTDPYVSPAGYLQNRHLVSLAKFEPEQEVPIAGATWKVFPVVRKAGMANNQTLHATGNIGYALRISP